MTVTNFIGRVVVVLLTNVHEYPILTPRDTNSAHGYSEVTGKRVVTTVMQTSEWEGGGLRFTNSELVSSSTVFYRAVTFFEPVQTNLNFPIQRPPVP